MAVMGRGAGEVEIRELYHDRGRIGGDMLRGAEAVMTLGGGVTLEAEAGLQILVPRASAVRLGDLKPTDRWLIPEASGVRWQCTSETRTKTLVLVFRREVRAAEEAPRRAHGQGLEEESSESEIEDDSASEDDNPDADMEMDDEGAPAFMPGRRRRRR